MERQAVLCDPGAQSPRLASSQGLATQRATLAGADTGPAKGAARLTEINFRVASVPASQDVGRAGVNACVTACAKVPKERFGVRPGRTRGHEVVYEIAAQQVAPADGCTQHSLAPIAAWDGCSTSATCAVAHTSSSSFLRSRGVWPGHGPGTVLTDYRGLVTQCAGRAPVRAEARKRPLVGIGRPVPIVLAVYFFYFSELPPRPAKGNSSFRPRAMSLICIKCCRVHAFTEARPSWHLATPSAGWRGGENHRHLSGSEAGLRERRLSDYGGRSEETVTRTHGRIDR
jgi:hypothetical protein